MSEILNGKQLPKDWKCVKFMDLVDKISLNKIKIKQKEYLPQGLFPVVDQGRELIGGYYNNDKLVVPDEPPYVIFGDHTKVKKFINFKFIAGADGVKVLKARNIIDPKFLFYSLFNLKIEDKGYARHYQLLEKELFPLPPLPTQLAIVSKIEELFSELDKGIESLRLALQQLKTYRQSVLKWAFEGRLTNENVKDGELPKEWRWVKFGDIHEIKSNLVNALDYLDSPHIAPDNISKRTAQLLSYNTIRQDKVFSPKHKFYKGQILYSKIRPNLAKVIIAPLDGLCSADMYPIDSSLDNRFTLYYMLSNFFVSKASNSESRTILPKINQKGLNEIPFPLCSNEEQNRIVDEIETRLSVADKLEENITQNLQKAESLKQSILKKAFEGKLI